MSKQGKQRVHLVLPGFSPTTACGLPYDHYGDERWKPLPPNVVAYDKWIGPLKLDEITCVECRRSQALVGGTEP